MMFKYTESNVRTHDAHKKMNRMFGTCLWRLNTLNSNVRRHPKPQVVKDAKKCRLGRLLNIFWNMTTDIKLAEMW